MTTIAYKNGVIAYDSFYTSGNVITNHNAEKKKIAHGGVIFFMTGAVSDEEELIRAYFGETVSNNIDASALVIDKDRLYLTSIDHQEGFWRSPLDWNNYYAIGSGSSFALTAMDMGADAKKAVEMAIYRDVKSGGKIRSYKIKSANKR